ncbi:MAG: hypothetical protein ABI351_05685 [Herbaspirillum sp.]
MKTVWISALAHEQTRVAIVSAQLKRYGLASQGHFWDDNPSKVSWRIALAALEEAHADMWLILVDSTELAKPSIRYGLSLMALAVREQRGASFPIVLLSQAATIATSELPPALQRSSNLSETASSWMAKIVAAVNLKTSVSTPEYHLNVLGDERLGQWFELGPWTGNWNGIIFGVTGADAEIDFQATGPRGALPEKSTLEFAQQGLQIQAGEQQFTAWALRNAIKAETSYFARVKGCPQAILFMPYGEDGDGADAEASVIQLI